MLEKCFVILISLIFVYVEDFKCFILLPCAWELEAKFLEERLA